MKSDREQREECGGRDVARGEGGEGEVMVVLLRQGGQ